jgi:hypothetical protein
MADDDSQRRINVLRRARFSEDQPKLGPGRLLRHPGRDALFLIPVSRTSVG